MSHLILALDIGTSSSRTALFTAAGERLVETTAQQEYLLVVSGEGAAELEPAVLEMAIVGCMEKTIGILRRSPKLRNRKIAAIGVSCFWHSLIGLDAKGAPLTRIITWADSRCRSDAAALRKKVREADVHARTGCMLRASFWPAKLLWLQRTEPRLFARVQRWLSPAEWLQLRFCGESTCAIGMATGTGLFDPSQLRWDEALLRRCHVTKESLGPLSDEPSRLLPRWINHFPELEGTQWFPGIGDGAASNLGSGATKPGLAAINVGTSAALRVMRRAKRAQAPLGLFAYRVDAERFLVGGAISNAGNLRAWGLRELNLGPDPAALEKKLSSRPTPDHGLTILPFWTAERAPTWNEDMRGTIVGLTQHTTSLDLLQAITEATYHRIALIAEMVVKEEPRTPKFLVSGGIQHSAAAMQRLADVLGHPIYANPEPEASIRGAAVFAIEKLGGKPAALKLPAPIRPRKKFAEAYAAAREKQRALESLMLRAQA